MADWGSALRPMKRSLSLFEKESFPIRHRPGRFLVLPAEAGTEIDELITLGANPRDIVGVERDGPTADGLYEHYFDRVPIHWIEANQFIERAEPASYSYIHLDYCGHLTETEIAAIAGSARIMAPHARLRVSLLNNRKTKKNVDFESLVRSTMLLPLIEGLSVLDERLGWAEVAHEFVSSEDATQLVAAIAILSHFFGVDPWGFADSAAQGGALPPVQGTHFIYNVQRWKYHEAGHPPVMETIWMDMMHLPAHAQTQETAPVQLYQLLYSLITSPSDYGTTLGDNHDSLYSR